LVAAQANSPENGLPRIAAHFSYRRQRFANRVSLPKTGAGQKELVNSNSRDWDRLVKTPLNNASWVISSLNQAG
jgi:hypothetical protein